VTWVAWRTQRAQFIAVLATLAVLTIWLWLSAVAMGHNQTWKYWTNADVDVLIALPGVLGLALGAPIVARGASSGGDKLDFTQSVTRSRWFLTKAGVGVLVAIVSGVSLTIFLQWWTQTISISPLTQSAGFDGNRIQPAAFDLTGFVVVAYVFFAFWLGVVLGTVIRKSGWAFAIGLPVFACVRTLVQINRSHFIMPAVATSLLGRVPATVTHGWMLNLALLPSNRVSPAPGIPWSSWDETGKYLSCKSSALTNAGVARCARTAHVHFVFQFQPMSHYWSLQSFEASIFVILGLVFFAFAFIRVRQWKI
jgi:hypothetical protein